MGLDLYSLKKRKTFKEEELQHIINKEKEMEIKSEEFYLFAKEFCESSLSLDLDNFLENSEHEIRESFWETPILRQKEKELGLYPYPYDDEGTTTSPILNYFFKHCDYIHWNDIYLEIDESLIKNTQANFAAEIAGNQSIPKERKSLEDLQIYGAIIMPENIPEAISRLKSRTYICSNTLRIIKFMQKYPKRMFAFL